MKTTEYFRNIVPIKHPEVQMEWIERVMAVPIKRLVQDDGRIVLWGNIVEAKGRALRVVLLEDGETVHNTFFDRNFLKRQQKGKEPK